MTRTLLLTAIFATNSLFFSQLTLAEESPAFVARNAAIQEKAQGATDQAVAAQKAADKAAQDS